MVVGAKSVDKDADIVAYGAKRVNGVLIIFKMIADIPDGGRKSIGYGAYIINLLCFGKYDA